MEPLTILSAFVPVIADGAKAAVNKFLGENKEDFKPATVEEAIELQRVEIEKLNAIYNLGANAETYKWVEAVRKLQRPVVVAGILVTWCYVHATDMPDTTAIDNMASAVGFFLFGDRSLFYIRKARGK